MDFCKTIYKKEIVFIVNSEIMDEKLFDKIILNCNFKKRIGLDMKNIKNINSEKFIEYLIKNKIKLFNLQSETLAYLALILKDGFLKSYMNLGDFKEEKRELIRRKLLVA